MPHATCATKIVYLIITTIVVVPMMWLTNDLPWPNHILLYLALGAEALVWLAGSVAILFNNRN